MKIILILFALALGIGATKAQETKPSFEETINYIRNIFKENEVRYYRANNNKVALASAFKIDSLNVLKNGKVTF